MISRATHSWSIFEAAHLLNRGGFGGSPQEIRKFHALGREKAVESLLSPDEAADSFKKPEWSGKEQQALELTEREKQRRQLRRKGRTESAEAADMALREFRRQFQRENRRRVAEIQGWWFRRMLVGKAPLREKMTLFWHDHFATSAQKVNQPALLLQQNEIFRAHAFGSFKDLTLQIVTDPAMMLYLDTQNSRKGMPNENFAREVLELFTLGEGNYSEQDIREAARAFTGYRVNRYSGEVSHMPRQWDDTEKVIFGKKGKFRGEDVVDLIFSEKDPSKFLTAKIWEFFVHETPKEQTVSTLAMGFRESGYQVKSLLHEIFLSKEFYSAEAMRTQIKCPVQYLIALMKQLEIKQPPFGFPLTAQQQLGQTLFMPPNVAGWDWGQAWINTNTLLTRYNLAGFLTKGSGRGAGKAVATEGGRQMVAVKKNDRQGWQGPNYEKIAPRPLRENTTELVDSLIFRFFQGQVPEKARQSFIDYAEAKKGVIFTNTETAELCHLMLSTPYYQIY